MLTNKEPTIVNILSPCSPKTECPKRSAKTSVTNPKNPIKKTEDLLCLFAPFKRAKILTGITTNKIDKCTTSSLGKNDMKLGYITIVTGKSRQCSAHITDKPMADLSARA